MSRLKLLESYLKVNGEPPCNVKFCFEGEEEVGSVHLDDYISQNHELFRADAVFWEWGGVDDQGRPIVGLGVKGMIYLELVLKSLSIDAHSSYAAALPSAPWRLIRALNLIKDEDERVSVPGWYDKVENLTEEEERVLEEEPFDGESFKRYYGAQSFVGGITASQARKALARRPTANIAGIWAGYTGPGSKTVLPKARPGRTPWPSQGLPEGERFRRRIGGGRDDGTGGSYELQRPLRAGIDQGWGECLREEERRETLRAGDRTAVRLYPEVQDPGGFDRGLAARQRDSRPQREHQAGPL